MNKVREMKIFEVNNKRERVAIILLLPFLFLMLFLYNSCNPSQGGQTSAQVVVSTFTATPESIDVGGSSLLSWRTENCSSCSIDNGIGSVATTGSITVTPDTSTTYILTAIGDSGTRTAQLKVTVKLPIVIENLTNNETVGFELLLIKGMLQNPADSVTLTLNANSQAQNQGLDPLSQPASNQYQYPVHDSQFKALIPLQFGKNNITLSAQDSASTNFKIKYIPKTKGPFVRMVYIIGADSDGKFMAPSGEPNDVPSAKRRLAFCGKLQQTACAELMYNAGYGRKTYRLERNNDWSVKVTVFRSKLTNAEARAMDDVDRWYYLYGELSKLPKRNKSIDMAILGMSHYDPATGKLEAEAGLGGGYLASIGSIALHSWPENLNQLVDRFTDDRYVKDYGMYNFFPWLNGTFWINCATTIGAGLHELGHTSGFGLHFHVDPDSCGIMYRGFDHINRLFVMTENGSIITNEDICWMPECAKILNTCDMLNSDSASAAFVTYPTIGPMRYPWTIKSIKQNPYLQD